MPLRGSLQAASGGTIGQAALIRRHFRRWERQSHTRHPRGAVAEPEPIG
jgi:hypothetical protein